MSFGIRYTTVAWDDIHLLDKVVAQRIVLKIRHYCSTENPMLHALALHGDLKGHYRFRVGDYRVIFLLERPGKVTICVVERVKHRKEVYE